MNLVPPAAAVKVVVVGQGYVGLPLAVRAVEVGYSVVGFDVDERRCKQLEDGEPFTDDVTGAQLAAALESGRYQATADPDSCAGFGVAVITVPTPLREGAPDISAIEDAGRVLAEHLRPGSTVILESTSYPGTTDELLVPILEAGSRLKSGSDFHVGYSPERIDPGNRAWRFTNTPKIVSGVDGRSLDVVKAFYDTLVETTVPVVNTREAELAKLLENTFRQVNIALVNELAVFADELGIDIWAVIDAAASKPFGFMRFTPGPGVGGHCLPIDPSYLAWRVERQLGRPFRFVALAQDINNHMPDYVVQRLVLALNRHRRPVNGSRILLLGLSYKRNSGDARESPAIAVAQKLVELGASVDAADPHLSREFSIPGVTRRDLTPALVADADAVVVLTDHDAFDRDLVASNARYVLDTRRWLSEYRGGLIEFL